MNVPAASLDQVQVGLDGHVITIDAEVSTIARDLAAIPLAPEEGVDKVLKLRYAEATNCFIVYEERTRSNGHLLSKGLVTTWDANQGPLTHAFVDYVRGLASPRYSAEAELTRMDAQQERDRKHALIEETGPKAERLAHSLRKDTYRDQGRIFLPRGVDAP